MPDADPAKGTEVDPRIERSRRLICEAALAELAEVGYGSLSIESIAKRAGVGKATVYRHWQGKLDLVASALETMKDDMALPETGTARERIIHLVTWLADYLGDHERSGALPALVSAAVYDDSVREFHYRFSTARRQVIVDLIDEGVTSGEFDLSDDIDTELVAETIVGPLFYRRLMSNEEFDSVRVVEIIDLVLGRR